MKQQCEETNWNKPGQGSNSSPLKRLRSTRKRPFDGVADLSQKQHHKLPSDCSWKRYNMKQQREESNRHTQYNASSGHVDERRTFSPLSAEAKSLLDHFNDVAVDDQKLRCNAFSAPPKIFYRGKDITPGSRNGTDERTGWNRKNPYQCHPALDEDAPWVLRQGYPYMASSVPSNGYEFKDLILRLRSRVKGSVFKGKFITPEDETMFFNLILKCERNRARTAIITFVRNSLYICVLTINNISYVFLLSDSNREARIVVPGAVFMPFSEDYPSMMTASGLQHDELLFTKRSLDEAIDTLLLGDRYSEHFAESAFKIANIFPEALRSDSVLDCVKSSYEKPCRLRPKHIAAIHLWGVFSKLVIFSCTKKEDVQRLFPNYLKFLPIARKEVGILKCTTFCQERPGRVKEVLEKMVKDLNNPFSALSQFFSSYFH